MKRGSGLCLAVAVCLCSLANAATYYVPDNYSTIQGAVDASVSGDTILVRPGTYTGQTSISAKGILLKSTNGPLVTTIEAPGQKGIFINNTVGADTAVVDGFTVRNCSHGIWIDDGQGVIQNNIIRENFDTFETACGGGICARYCSYVLIRNNTITDNYAQWKGGGIWTFSGTVIIEDNLIASNETDAQTAGIRVEYSLGRISGNTVTGNTPGGIQLTGNNPMTVFGNVIAWNIGAGFVTDWPTNGTYLYNNTIVYNTGTGLAFAAAPGSSTAARNCIIRGNADEVTGDQLRIDYCDIEGGWSGLGTGNIDVDPMFCDSADTNFRLHEASPCIGAGEGGADMGALGVGCGDQLIQGTVFLDANENGVYEPGLGESGLANRKIVMAPLGVVSFSDDLGQFLINAPTGSFEISCNLRTCEDQTSPTAPAHHDVVLDAGDDTTGLDFGIRYACDTIAGEAVLALTRIRPGRPFTGSLLLTNTGTLPWDSATFIINVTDNISFQTSPMRAGEEECEFYETGGIPPFYEYETYSYGIGPAGSDACNPMGNGGENLQCGEVIDVYWVLIKIYNGVTTIQSGHDYHEGRCPLDPNEMSVYPDSMITRDQRLRYHIDFQNVGTDTAFDVIVVDTLDPNLDLSSLESVVASHDFTFSVSGDRVVTFVLDEIGLPDSTENELGSQGFVEFTIIPLPDLPLGTEIHNRAGITFDFMPPVMTNEVINTIGCCDVAGDANHDAMVNLADAVFLINYVFKGGPAPTCDDKGDANFDCSLNLADAVYLINYVFKGGPAPQCGCVAP